MIAAEDRVAAAAPTALLPDGFAALDAFAGWALTDETARYRRRIETPYPDLLAFYQAMQPLLAAALALVDRHPFDAMPPAVARLYAMILSMMEAGVAVEIFGASDVPAAVPADRIRIHVPGYGASREHSADPHA